MARQTVSGRAGSATVNGTVIPITSWTAKGTKELADATDSANFDPTTGQLWKSQAPGAVAMEITLEGNFDLSTTDNAIIHLLKQDPPAAIVLMLTPTLQYASGNFDLSDCETKVTVPGGTMITFTANAKSNGVVTF